MLEKLMSTGVPPFQGVNQTPLAKVSTWPADFLFEIAGLMKKLSIAIFLSFNGIRASIQASC